MKSMTMMTCVLFAAIAAFADKPAAEKLQRFGGEGHVSLVNAGGLAKNDALVEVQKGMEELLLVPIKISTGTWTLATADEAAKATGAKAAVFVVKDDALPISLVAMESRWAVVNAKDLTDKAARREVMRVASILLGAAYSQYDASVMRPAFSRDDLEKKVGDAFTIDVLLPILNGMQRIGIKQFELMTKEEAVEAGYLKKTK